MPDNMMSPFLCGIASRSYFKCDNIQFIGSCRVSLAVTNMAAKPSQCKPLLRCSRKQTVQFVEFYPEQII